MRLKKTIELTMAEKFEASLDYIEALDKVPFYLKRAAAEEAAKTAFEYLRAARPT